MSYRGTVQLLVCASLFLGCGPTPSPRVQPPPPRSLDPELEWHADNRVQLEALIRSLGSGSPGFDPDHPPVAVFDCDNTLIRNDIAAATVYWFFDRDLIKVPPGSDWGRTSEYLTAEARSALASACGDHPDGATLPTRNNPACTDEILSIYDGTTTSAEPAWVETGYDHRAFVPPYAWMAQLQAGYTPAEVRAFTRSALDRALAADIGASRVVGSRPATNAYIRLHAQMKDLIAVLEANGFAVWVVSASPQASVEAVAERFGVRPERVIGIRTHSDEQGRLTYGLKSCGSAQEPTAPIMTFMDGKRCWIDQEIFAGPGRLDQHPEPSHRAQLVAGDSSTDISMLLDATALRLVINRNKPELMCHAYHGTAGAWLVNPQFVEPMSRRVERYPCASTACLDHDGSAVPCRDTDGTVIADQEDRVYAP